MRFDWPLVQIGSVAEVFDGPHATPKKTASGPVFLGISALNRGRLDLSNLEHLSSADFERWTRRVVPRGGDVVFSYETRLGEVAILPEGLQCCLGRRMALVRVHKSRLEPDYLLYYFLSDEFQEVIRERTIFGSTVERLLLREFPEFPIRLPPVEHQREVASILKGLDDRIDLLRQTNTTLEAIAQALFKSWFVNFDPVHANAEAQAHRVDARRGQPSKPQASDVPQPEAKARAGAQGKPQATAQERASSAAGTLPAAPMDAATAALFPSEFEESELGLIPKGWSVRSLDAIANYLNGLALQKFPPESETEFLPVIKIAQLHAGHTTDAGRASAHLKPAYVVHDGDVLFSWSGSLEVELWCGGDGALNQHLFKVTSDEVPKWFYYLATRLHLPEFRSIAASKATTMGHIQRKHLALAKVAMPPPTVMATATEIIAPLLERRIINSLQMRELAQLRDTLLPPLISGKLRLPETMETAKGDAFA